MGDSFEKVGLPAQADVHLALDVGPLLGRAERGDELVERGGVLGRVLEPGKEVEGSPGSRE